MQALYAGTLAPDQQSSGHPQIRIGVVELAILCTRAFA
jgi:hypothetical protein